MKFLIKAKTLEILIILDIISTIIALNIGGIEYNKVSLILYNYNYLAFIIAKLLLLFMVYIIDYYTNEFKKKPIKVLVFFINIYYLLTVFFNFIFIIFKLKGLI